MAYEAPTYVAPGGGPNTFVPSFEASGKLIVGYSRNPNEFALNRYVQIQPVEQGVGLWLNLDPANAARVLGANGEDFIWPDSHDAPTGADNPLGFTFLPYQTARYAPPFRIGWKSQKQATWDIIAAYAAQCAQQAMTLRTKKAVAVVTDSDNYPSANTSTATALVGAKLDTSTGGDSGTNLIRKAFNKMFAQLQKASYSKVKPSQVHIVMNPDCAFALAQTTEVIQYVRQSPFGLASLAGEAPVNEAYNLPNKMYGYRLTVEEACVEPTKKGATPTPQYVFPDETLAMLARPGELEIPIGSPTFSSVTCFELVNLAVEIMDDPNNKRIQGRVIDDYVFEMTAPVSSYLLTSVTS